MKITAIPQVLRAATITLISALATGCATDYKSAILYGRTEPKSDEFARPGLSGKSDQFFNGNVIRVPRGQLAQFGLSEIKVGWLAESSSYRQAFPTQRLLPDKTLWLVTQIEGFKADDFLRTSSKRSFIASAVKQNQNSQGYVPLDAAERAFSLQTSDYQYEVTFTLYSIDNFKLKQVLGFAVKDNPSLIKIGWDALKQLGGTTYSFVAEPMIRSAKHEFGEEFLFERVLLTAGAVTEFKGMVYVVGDDEVKPGPQEPNIGTFALADLSEVDKEQDLNALAKKYPEGFGRSQPRPTHVHKDPEFRKEYSKSLAAINSTVTSALLRDQSANVLFFTLSSYADKNRLQASQTEQLQIIDRRIEDELKRIADLVSSQKKSQIDGIRSQLEELNRKADTLAGRIAAGDSNHLQAAAMYLVKSVESASDKSALEAIRTALGLPVGISPDIARTQAKSELAASGLSYQFSSKPDLKIQGSTEDPIASVAGKSASLELPDKIKSRLDGIVVATQSLIGVLDEYAAYLESLEEARDEATFKQKTGTESITKIDEKFRAILEQSSTDPIVKQLAKSASTRFPSTLGGKLLEAYQSIGRANAEKEKVTKAEGGIGTTGRIPIF